MEAKITIEGHELTMGQSMAIRVAVTSFLLQLQDPRFRRDLGSIAWGYQQRLDEVITMINEGAS